MANIDLHPLGASQKTVTINIDQVQKIEYFGWCTRLHLVGGGYQDVKEKKHEIEAILGR